MQMFGVGALELLVVLILAVLVVGPDRLPQVAADLGRWIRQTRAYAKHLMGDFNEVMSELRQEAEVSQEDWKEIASVVSRHTGSVGHELTRFGRDVEESGDLSDIKLEEETTTARANGNGAAASETEDEVDDGKTDLSAIVTDESISSGEEESEARADEDVEPEQEKPWYEPERASRRRSSE